MHTENTLYMPARSMERITFGKETAAIAAAAPMYYACAFDAVATQTDTHTQVQMLCSYDVFNTTCTRSHNVAHHRLQTAVHCLGKSKLACVCFSARFYKISLCINYTLLLRSIHDIHSTMLCYDGNKSLLASWCICCMSMVSHRIHSTISSEPRSNVMHMFTYIYSSENSYKSGASILVFPRLRRLTKKMFVKVCWKIQEKNSTLSVSILIHCFQTKQQSIIGLIVLLVVGGEKLSARNGTSIRLHLSALFFSSVHFIAPYKAAICMFLKDSKCTCWFA